MANKKPSEPIAAAVTETQKLNKELLKTEEITKRIFGNLSKIVKPIQKLNSSSGVGVGSNRQNLGTENANIPSTGQASQTSQPTQGSSSMPWMYTTAGAGTLAAAKVGLGLAGAAYAAAPGLDSVIPTASAYYGSSLRGPLGTTRQQISTRTIKALNGGVSSPLDAAAASNILTQSYFYNPRGSAYTNTMAEVGGAARALNMNNAEAAQALGGLQTGPMGGNLYQYGIHTIDPMSGKQLSTEQIARQMFNRIFTNQKGLTYKDVQGSLQYGFAGANLRNMGLSENQQKIFGQAFLNFSQGKGFDLKTEGGADNPASKYYEYQTSQANLINKKTDAELAGYAQAMDAAIAFNKELENMSDALFKLKGLIQGIASTALGAAVGVAGSAVGTAVTGLFGARALGKILGKTTDKAVKGGLKTAVKAGAARYAAPIVAASVMPDNAAGFLGTVALSAGTGALFGGGVPGALVGAGLGAATWAVNNMFGSTTKALATSSGTPSGSTSEQQKTWATQFLQKAGAPVTEQNLQAITTWMNAEGGHWKNTAKYNPLNTTKTMPGAKTMQGSSAGVKSYASWNQGLEANVKTLNLSYYDDVRAALNKGDDANAVLQAVQNSPWAAGHYGYKLASGSSSASTTASAGNKTVNISLNIDKATHEEAVKLAKEVKRILQNDKDLNKIGSK